MKLLGIAKPKNVSSSSPSSTSKPAVAANLRKDSSNADVGASDSESMGDTNTNDRWQLKKGVVGGNTNVVVKRVVLPTTLLLVWKCLFLLLQSRMKITRFGPFGPRYTVLPLPPGRKPSTTISNNELGRLKPSLPCNGDTPAANGDAKPKRTNKIATTNSWRRGRLKLNPPCNSDSLAVNGDAKPVLIPTVANPSNIKSPHSLLC
jgi:hypothetical protein